ncbi:MAG: dockerin type I domain-containing protein [Microgenomates group bacterium]|nr:dockerin type I domain-containing protein [Microgenomates group bacterium]
MKQINANTIKILAYLGLFACLIILGIIIVRPKTQFTYKPKAASANGVDLSFSGFSTVTADGTAGKEYYLTIRKTSSEKIVTGRIVFEFPANILQPASTGLITYQTPFTSSQLSGGGLTATNQITVFADAQRDPQTRDLIDPGITADIAVVKFIVRSDVTNGLSGKFVFKNAEIVGESGRLTVEQYNPLTITVSQSGVTNTPGPSPTPTRTPTPTTPAATNTPGPAATVTQGPSPTSGGPSPTAGQTTETQSQNITLNLKLKFQGVLKRPSGDSNKLQVKVRAVGGGKEETKTAEFTANDNAVWTGSVTFTTLTPGTNYRIYTKGPKHLRKKICSASPLETYPGTYHCDDGQIALAAGQNTFDFSNIYQLVGDLPGQGGMQDGIVNSYDTSLVTTNLNKNDSQAVNWADLNLDGVVNAQDYSLIIAALSIRSDE